MSVTLPTIPTEMLAVAVVCFLAGAATPVYYAQERLRGFGRAMMSKLPYRPPPGSNEETALVEATTADAEPNGGADDGN